MVRFRKSSMNNQQLISNYYAQHRDEIVSFIAVRIADADEAQDRVQDIFLQLLRRHQLITPITLPSLVYTMARHEVVDHFRHRRVYEEYEHYIQRGDNTENMESVVSARLLMERMERSLARLPEACARIYRLQTNEEMYLITQTFISPYTAEWQPPADRSPQAAG